MRMRKKHNLAPRMEACGDIWIRDPKQYRGRWRTLLPDVSELRLEIGCGKGRFLIETAKTEPSVLFLALEKVPDAMIMAMEHAVREGVGNVFFMDADAAVLPELFAPRGARPHLPQLSRPLAPKQERAAAPDLPRLPRAVQIRPAGRRGAVV